MGSRRADVHTNCFSSTLRVSVLTVLGNLIALLFDKYAPESRQSPGLTKSLIQVFSPVPSQRLYDLVSH